MKSIRNFIMLMVLFTTSLTEIFIKAENGYCTITCCADWGCYFGGQFARERNECTTGSFANSICNLTAQPYKSVKVDFKPFK